MRRRWASLFLAAAVCGDAGAPAPARVSDAPGPLAAAWSDGEKCANMCHNYCVHLNACNGTDVAACRMAIDHADGGDCTVRAVEFAKMPQSVVQACIDATNAMTCAQFLAMYNTGEGVPAPCVGILN